MLNQFVRFVSSLFGQKKVQPSEHDSPLLEQKKVLRPESDFLITLTDELIEVTHPNGTREMVRWDDVQTISVTTTDDGPFAPDVWFVLMGNEGGCVFPQGASKEDEAFKRISQFDGFDFDMFIKSMSSAENARFLLWQRQPKPSMETKP